MADKNKMRKVRTFFASTQHGEKRAFENLDSDVNSFGKNRKIFAISDTVIPSEFVELTHRGIKPETMIARSVLYED